jgi:hypothetical protein
MNLDGRSVWVGLVLILTLVRVASAKLPVNSLQFVVGFGVEENASPAREILELWKHYLTEPSDSLRATLWSAPERGTDEGYDLIAAYVYQGFTRYTVVDLGPAAGPRETYVIRTLVSAVEDSTLNVRPLALYRVYATIEDGRWVLANALPRSTQAWERDTVGRITFIYPKGQQFDPRRAHATSAFADSLAKAFDLPQPDPMTYYFTDDLATTLRALGLEFFPLGGDPVGGRSNTFKRHVYVGSATNGEYYLHEVAHIVLASEVSSKMHRLVAEGLMTWTGGSAGLSYYELLPALAQYLSEHPDLSLQSVLKDPPKRRGTLDVGYSGVAVLCKMVFDGAGLPGLRALLSAGRDPDTIVGIAADTLGVDAAELNKRWRKECGVR